MTISISPLQASTAIPHSLPGPASGPQAHGPSRRSWHRSWHCSSHRLRPLLLTLWLTANLLPGRVSAAGLPEQAPAPAVSAALAESGMAAKSLRFGLFGDTPYSPFEREQLPLMLQAMGEAGLAFAIHDGDIKGGGQLCNDAVYADIRQVFEQAPLPLIYVPGDNEWTDCHRKACGGYRPEERLSHLREVFYPDHRSLGQRKLALQRQTDWPENVRWEWQRVLFVTLNIPGDDNNIKHPEEAKPRQAANTRWLAESFKQASEKALRAVVIDIQANPFIEDDNADRTRPGFREFLDQLRQETAAFNGQVVLVHGDTHSMQINKPLKDRKTQNPVENFTRVETYGAPFMGWVEATLLPDDPAVFRFTPRPWPGRGWSPAP